MCAEDVLKLYNSVERKSGPGHPWVALAKTKGEIIDNYSELLVEAVLETVRIWTTYPAGTLPDDPVALVEMGASAPVRLFVKNEPHTREKLDVGRVRLISMCSLHMVLAEKLLCGKQNEMEIAHWASIPSKPGIGLAEDAHIEIMHARVKELVGTSESGMAEGDASGWDFSVSWNLFKAEADARCYLAGVTSGPLYNGIQNCIWVLARSVFALSDGRMYKQLYPGIMKSGSYLTSSSNSRMRVIAALSIGASWCEAMGDDSLEEYVENAIEKYARLGIRMKYYTRCGATFDFCSHEFANGVAYPSNPGKMMYNLLNQNGDFKEKFNHFQQWYFEMRHSPDVDSWVELLERSGWAAQINGS